MWLVFDGQSIWVSYWASDIVTRLALDGTNLGSFSVGDNPYGLTFDGENIWVANSLDGTVMKLKGGPIATTPAPNAPPLPIRPTSAPAPTATPSPPTQAPTRVLVTLTPQPTSPPIEFPELLSVAGRVAAVDVQDNSFVLQQPKEGREFTVRLGQGTEFIRLVFPFDLNNPPTDATFTPEREKITIEELEVGDQVFIRSAIPIRTGDVIVGPLEVQALP